MFLYLFSSQVPFAFFLEGILKLVEVIHQEFLKQEWLREVRLGDSNLLTTCPCLFGCVVKNTEREGLESSTAAWTMTFGNTWNRTNDNKTTESITWGYCRPLELSWRKPRTPSNIKLTVFAEMNYHTNWRHNLSRQVTSWLQQCVRLFRWPYWLMRKSKLNQTNVVFADRRHLRRAKRKISEMSKCLADLSQIFKKKYLRSLRS